MAVPALPSTWPLQLDRSRTQAGSEGAIVQISTLSAQWQGLATGSLVAVKSIKINQRGSEQERAAVREAKLVAILHHPHLCQGITSVWQGDVLHIAMHEYTHSLAVVLDDRRMNPPFARRLNWSVMLLNAVRLVRVDPSLRPVDVLPAGERHHPSRLGAREHRTRH